MPIYIDLSTTDPPFIIKHIWFYISEFWAVPWTRAIIL